jgi:hypothetical protein
MARLARFPQHISPLATANHTIMESGFMKDDTAAATAARDDDSNLYCARPRRWWNQLSPATRVILFVTMYVVWFTSCFLIGRFGAEFMAGGSSECQKYQHHMEFGPAYDNKDSFAFSEAWYSWGWFFSYKKIRTGKTIGPRILILQDIWNSWLGTEFKLVHGLKGNCSMDFQIEQISTATIAYVLELSIGKDANGNVVWSSSDDDNDHDDNVVIEPSVWHVRFSNGATYSLYNDTVFFISYKFAGSELQVKQRPIDLKGVSRQCGIKRLFQRNADLAAFEAQWNSTWISRRLLPVRVPGNV